MPAKLSTTLNNIDKVQNQVNASLLEEFYKFMKNNGTSETYQNNNLKAMIHISQLIAKRHGPDATLYYIRSKEQVIDLSIPR